MDLNQYIVSINKRYKSGNATEHTFRGDLQQLLETLIPDCRATNEPKRQACGAPDFIVTRNDIPVGFLETKGIECTDLDGIKENKEQFDRYKPLGNIIFTNYLDFHYYKDGILVMNVAIGRAEKNRIVALHEKFPAFETLLNVFSRFTGQTITSPKKLAEMMAGKARLLADVISKSLDSDEENEEDSSLKSQLKGFKEILIHDILNNEFADVYAQTIAYGMFAARLYDESLNTFSRQEAAELIPKSNPFLRNLFSYIAGIEIDDRIRWIVDSLAKLFQACDVKAILQDFGKTTKTEDPIIHFYETFLATYDPGLRKARGVWYTPHPVVSFIVRAIDYLLKSEFALPMGLADSTKVPVMIKKKDREIEKEFHKVQFLDPATGTATFLVEVIKLIHGQFKGQEGAWNDYVEKHLIPRLNGFEILMASYAMAHLKLDLVLKETGFKYTNNQRLKVFLTNSLEYPPAKQMTVYMAQWLQKEADEASAVKQETPVMVVAGNPPYSGESVNKGLWIMDLMKDYKMEPGGKERLREKNPKWINDDYVKFLRYGQHFIEKNKSGILAFINPHGFLDNPTFRGMRWNLLKTFDMIYIVDLHGNAKKKETAPDGGKDENVFDIQQGVSINFFIKTGRKKNNELGKVFHYDLFGMRDFKYDFLNSNSIHSINFNALPNVAPNYFFVRKDFDTQDEYFRGFLISELFPLSAVGIVTARDHFTLHATKEDVKSTIDSFLSLDDETARSHFNLGKDVRDWKVKFAKKDLVDNYPNKGAFTKLSYRPFDYRWTFFTGKSKGFHCYPRKEVMQHFVDGNNVGLTLCKQFKTGENYYHTFISNRMIESSYVSNRTSEITSLFPLYLYPEKNKLDFDGHNVKTPNLNSQIVNLIAVSIGLTFVNEKENTPNTFAPIDLLDYIYAVLHSPEYREKYKEFLKIDFPKIPYPTDKEKFWRLVSLGGEIRQLHLMESPKLNDFITGFPVTGENTVEKITFTDGRVYINSNQYFEGVPQVAWKFYIGGYQPAQKWLKERKGRQLSFDDVVHYHKIIIALTETDRLMQEIDKIGFK